MFAYNSGSVSLSDGTQNDATGRLRTSSLMTLFNSKTLVEDNPLYWSNLQISGTGTTATWNGPSSGIKLAVANTTAGSRIRQTKQYFNFQAGRSQYVSISFILGALNNNIKKSVGYYDADNGVFLQSDAGIVNLVLRTKQSGSVVDTIIPQSSWNENPLMEAKDRYIIDWAVSQTLLIDFEWQGRMRVGFEMDGKFIVAHTFNTANNVISTQIVNPNLPVRFEIQNTGTGPLDELVCISTSVCCEGGQDLNTITRSISTSTVPLTNVTSSRPLIVIRKKATYPYSTITMKLATVYTNNGGDYMWRIVMNPTLTGTQTYTALQNSSLEYINNGNALTVSGGTDIFTSFNSTTSNIIGTNINLGVEADGTRDIVAIIITKISTANGSNFYGSISFEEDY